MLGLRTISGGERRLISGQSTNREARTAESATPRPVGQSPFGRGYCIVDPDAPARVARDARRIQTRGMVQVCTLVDAWAPETQGHRIGRRCLEALLGETGWTVRILTKNAAVTRDFDIIERHRDRVLVGLSLTGTSDADHFLRIIEPNASPIGERIDALRAAHARGLRTYGMLCPLLPGLSDGADQIERLVQLVVECGAEEVFVEPVNQRGRALPATQEALEVHGCGAEAAAIGRVRKKENWSRYVVDLLRLVQDALQRRSTLAKLRFLLYPSGLRPEGLAAIQLNDSGVVWLGGD